MMRIPIRRPVLGGLDGKSKSPASTKTSSPDAEKSQQQQQQQPLPDPSHAACPICQEPVGEPTVDGITEEWASLPCGHAFGSGCIKTWLAITEHATCPICRLPMTHTCRHPVLPVLEPPPSRFAPAAPLPPQTRSSPTTPPPETRASSHPSTSLALLSPSSYASLIPRPIRLAAAFADKWRWNGRKLSGLCGFCAAVRKTPPLPVRLAAAALKMALNRSRRGRRIVAMQPSMYYGESEDDPWRIAFRTWWSQQEPKVEEPREEDEEPMTAPLAPPVVSVPAAIMEGDGEGHGLAVSTTGATVAGAAVSTS